jgi:hypothetical protein
MREEEKRIIASSSKAFGKNAESKQAPTAFTSTHPFRWRDTLSAVLGDVFLDPNFLHMRDIAQGRSIEIVIDLDFTKPVATFFSLLRSHGLRGHGLVPFGGLGFGVSAHHLHHGAKILGEVHASVRSE